MALVAVFVCIFNIIFDWLLEVRGITTNANVLWMCF